MGRGEGAERSGALNLIVVTLKNIKIKGKRARKALIHKGLSHF